jgi:hypothetical protein
VLKPKLIPFFQRPILRVDLDKTKSSCIDAIIDNGNSKEFSSVVELQSWIFQNAFVQEMKLNNVRVFFYVQIGQSSMPVHAYYCNLQFIPSLSFLDLATTEDFLSYLEEDSKNTMMKYRLPAEFLATKRSPDMLDVIIFFKNEIADFFNILRKRVSHYLQA